MLWLDIHLTKQKWCINNFPFRKQNKTSLILIIMTKPIFNFECIGQMLLDGFLDENNRYSKLDNDRHCGI